MTSPTTAGRSGYARDPRVGRTDEAREVRDAQLETWERWWTAVDGTPGEIVWDADETDLTADLAVFAGAFDPSLPVIDLGCGNGRQTRFLARHFETVVGTDISPAAVEHARAAENPPNVSYRVLDASSSEQAAQLHGELGDVNVYIRGVIQSLPVASRPRFVEAIALLLGECGALFAKELPPEASVYFGTLVERHGVWAELERVMQLIPPGQITQAELMRLFGADRFEVVTTGDSHIHTVNRLPDGEVIEVPAIFALIRPARALDPRRRRDGKEDR